MKNLLKNRSTKTPVYPTNLNILIKNEKKKDIFGFISPGAKGWIKTISKLLLQMVLIVWAVYTIVFFLVNIGNPYPQFISALPPQTPESVITHWENVYHLNDPLIVRYFYSIGDLFSGTMGLSWTYGLPVSQLLWPKFLLSIQIGIFALGLSVMIGIPLGFALARKKTAGASFGSALAAILAFAVPSFVIALVLSSISFALGLPTMFEYGNIYTMFICALALAIPVGFGYTRYLRNSVKDEYDSQYVKLARIKGASEKRVLWAHVAKPSLFPIINYLPLLMVGIIVGSITVESVFGVPGSGTLFVNSAINHDQSVLLASTVLYTMLIVIAMFIRDIWIRSIDPRMKVK